MPFCYIFQPTHGLLLNSLTQVNVSHSRHPPNVTQFPDSTSFGHMDNRTLTHSHKHLCRNTRTHNADDVERGGEEKEISGKTQSCGRRVQLHPKREGRGGGFRHSRLVKLWKKEQAPLGKGLSDRYPPPLLLQSSAASAWFRAPTKTKPKKKKKQREIYIQTRLRLGAKSLKCFRLYRVLFVLSISSDFKVWVEQKRSQQQKIKITVWGRVASTTIPRGLCLRLSFLVWRRCVVVTSAGPHRLCWV